MNELERFMQLTSKADHEIHEVSNLEAGVFNAIARRQQKMTSTSILAPCIATAFAAVCLVIAVRNYALDWQMATSDWPGIAQHVLFQEMP